MVEALVANAKRVELNWALAERSLPKAAVKVLLNFAQIGLDALVRGGTLDVGAESRDGASEIVVRAAGPRIAFDQNIGRALEGQLAVGELVQPHRGGAHAQHAGQGRRAAGLQYIAFGRRAGARRGAARSLMARNLIGGG